MQHSYFTSAHSRRAWGLPVVLIGTLGLLALCSGLLLVMGQALGLTLLLPLVALVYPTVRAVVGYLTSRPLARRRPLAPLPPAQRWQDYQDRKPLVVAHYRKQMRLALACGWQAQAIWLEHQLHQELHQLQRGCAMALHQQHVDLVGAESAAACWRVLSIGEDGGLPAPAALIALAGLPIGTPLAPADRLPFHGLAHQLACDLRQCARLRQLAVAASREAPSTAVLTRSMKLFLEMVCELTEVARCPVCRAFADAAPCQRCQALRTERWSLPHRLVALARPPAPRRSV